MGVQAEIPAGLGGMFQGLHSPFGAGFRVARNAPFAGAFVSQSYGRPSTRRHVVQVEIDRSLYMDERQVVPLPGFADFGAVITKVIRDVVKIGRDGIEYHDRPLAAE